MFTITNISAIIFLTFIVNLIIFYVSWQRRNSSSGLYFSLGMLGITIWTFGSALDYAAVPLYLKILFAKVEAVGYLSALSLLALFAIDYAGYADWLKKKWVKALFLLLPLSNILLILTNELHGWIWAGFVPTRNNVVIFERGPAFSWLIITSYLLVITIFLNLWMASRRGSNIARRQARLMMFAIIFPIGINLLYNLHAGGIEGVDWTSVTFSISGLLILRALYGTRLLDFIPIARDQLVNNLSDGMIVLDMQDRIVDINHAAENMLNAAPETLTGKNLREIVPLSGSFLDQVPGQKIQTEIQSEGTDHYYDLLISPLYDKNKIVIGRLIIFRDITARKENELRLLQLTRAVEQSPASVVITDVNGNMTYVNPHFTVLTGYAQDEALGKNPNILQSGQTPLETYREMWQTIQSGRTWQGELLNRKKNGDLYWEFEVVAPVLNNAGQIINFVAVKEDITARKENEFALEQRFLEVQELHKELQETQAQLVEQQRTHAKLEERQRMGRDMHDSVNQSIHSLMLFSETLIDLLEKEQTEKALSVARRIQDSGGQALKEVRLLLYESQSLLADKNTNLLCILEERLNMVERRVDIHAEIVCGDDVLAHYPPAWNENLYWMIIEALNNSLKHSQAHCVKIIFNGTAKKQEVEIVDDGIGFDLSQIQSGGFGMRSMRERAAALGGTLTVISTPGSGMRVCFKIEVEN